MPTSVSILIYIGDPLDFTKYRHTGLFFRAYNRSSWDFRVPNLRELQPRTKSTAGIYCSSGGPTGVNQRSLYQKRDFQDPSQEWTHRCGLELPGLGGGCCDCLLD
ncbi:uncharacterized protein BO95DRAFT_38737 [Aspergillus brunneoviolaceus CBS 621.78]|uniref:Uncharacterized protein n=1 Tax=Aspergillus brunneoviolaceus CBS 621.78 TaxID=1450534 RepID=A0ACD1GI26_9EURO|nr:hypothetical protein BO95DRAFT_38737 [Aspergillus brunneoviolaceus CBS 621.78]RAH48878.1 hypothetical protein BO95DRAFT_38737 [Aspergillus brunneoviolaceus CBS 621.78]